MDKKTSHLKKLFHLLTLLVIIISLYPGSLFGFFLYGDAKLQPQFAKDFSYFSTQHFCVYFVLSFVGFYSYLREKKFNLTAIYLFFLSAILELLHFIIPERSFEIRDLVGNILGVLIVYILVLIYKFWRK